MINTRIKMEVFNVAGDHSEKHSQKVGTLYTYITEETETDCVKINKILPAINSDEIGKQYFIDDSNLFWILGPFSDGTVVAMTSDAPDGVSVGDIVLNFMMEAGVVTEIDGNFVTISGKKIEGLESVDLIITILERS